MMYNTSNPAEIYSGTTWELLTTDKYLKTTTGTPLSTGGSNNFTIQKANLPAIKIQLESFSVTTQPHVHGTAGSKAGSYGTNAVRPENFGGGHSAQAYDSYNRNTKSGGGENTGTASPYTQNLGSGSAISINPTYITVRVWKRLS